MKSLWVNLFSADSGYLEPLCAAACALAAWPLDQPTRLPVGPNGAGKTTCVANTDVSKKISKCQQLKTWSLQKTPLPTYPGLAAEAAHI